MKTSDLTGPLLDYWVAKIEGCEHMCALDWDYDGFEPSTNWAQGGPLIEKYGIYVAPGTDNKIVAFCQHEGKCPTQFGDNRLIAGMRCIVASKFGDEVPDIAEGE